MKNRHQRRALQSLARRMQRAGRVVASTTWKSPRSVDAIQRASRLWHRIEELSGA